MVRDINQDFFLQIFEVMGGEAKHRASDLFYWGNYFTSEGEVMNQMKLVLSFKKRIMLKLWTDQTVVLRRCRLL